MLTEWLRVRCPSAKPIGIAHAANYKLTFGKRSIDKSGKATLIPTHCGHAPGVLFEIAESERTLLDEAEGFRSDKPRDPGRYRRDDVFTIRTVQTDTIVAASTYLANRPEDGLKPYDWYLSLVIAGAVQHGLDADYIDLLRNFYQDIDVELARENRVRALQTLSAAGYGNGWQSIKG
jgi:gamma-glutamylcyclotransferase